MDAIARARNWLAAKAGDLRPESLARTIAARYGKDRTFSVPILSMLALAGLLGEGRAAWRHVAQLPFELAAVPHKWFRFLSLNVVSYALPALIAIGQARHANRPSRNLLTRLVRGMAVKRTLRVLANIQPPSGGFLEAAPLTSFVVMNLCAVRQAWNPPASGAPSAGRSNADMDRVIDMGVAFLASNVRPDGSWPIDTNLATWVTTLAINAITRGEINRDSHHLCEAPQAVGGPKIDGDCPYLCGPVLDWLLAQQYRVEHPYTHAAPGGWAWTNLSGGVPDADDTAGAVLALRNLAKSSDCPDFPRVKEAAMAGINWLVDLQNRDGGMPTFCRGWGKLPFDRSAADLTAHAILAMSAWMDDLDAATKARARKAISRGLKFLRRTQRPDGSWLPLWFGNQHRPEEDNPTYGTARVVLALARRCQENFSDDQIEMIAKATGWLVRSQNADGGWGGAAGTPSSIEETALAVDALAMLVLRVPPSSVFRLGVVVGPDAKVLATSREHPQAEKSPLEGGTLHGGDAGIREAIARGVRWLIEHTNHGADFNPAPIGFYFAKLWYFEKLYPLVFTVAALARAKAAMACVRSQSQPADTQASLRNPA